MKSILSVLLLFAALYLTMAHPPLAASKETSLSEARDAIDANLRSPEGKTFDDRMGKEFVERHMTALRLCKASAGGDMTNFWMLLKLDKDGSVKEVLLHPTTKLGFCARDTYLKDKFLAPPRSDYWVGIYLQLSH
jgi:hypothetical protein